MNLKSLITGTFLLALSSTKAAAVRKTNSRTPHTSRVLRLTTLSPSVQSCQECKDGFRISTCIEVAYDSGGNATDQSVEQDMNITAAATCLLHVEGLDGESITSTCTCNARTNDSDIGFQQDPAQPSRFGLTAVLTVMFVYVACPVFMCAWFVSSCLRNRDEMSTGSTLRTQQEEPDSDDARKQRECVLAILFPSSVEKVCMHTSHGSAYCVYAVTSHKYTLSLGKYHRMNAPRVRQWRSKVMT